MVTRGVPKLPNSPNKFGEWVIYSINGTFLLTVAGNSAINDWSKSSDRSDYPSFRVARSIWQPWYLGSEIDPVTQSLGDRIDLATQALSAGIDPVTQPLGAQIDLVTQMFQSSDRSDYPYIGWQDRSEHRTWSVTSHCELFSCRGNIIAGLSTYVSYNSLRIKLTKVNGVKNHCAGYDEG